MRFGGGKKGLILSFFTPCDNKAINSPLSPLPPSLGFLPLHVWSSPLALVWPRASQKPALKVGVIPLLGAAVTGNGRKSLLTTERTSPGEQGQFAVVKLFIWFFSHGEGEDSTVAEMTKIRLHCYESERLNMKYSKVEFNKSWCP